MALVDVDLIEYTALSTGLFRCDRVSVQALEFIANAGYDGFGRPKAQPIAIDATVFLRQPFAGAAARDAMDESTKHYGTMSKELLQAAASARGEWQQPYALLEALAETLREEKTTGGVRDFRTAGLELVVRFKNASLASREGSTLTLRWNGVSSVICTTFGVEGMAMPALIGINEHERQMRQQVVVSVWVDRVGAAMANECHQIEQIVVKTVEESSFGMLEALAEAVAGNVIKLFILARRSTAEAVEEEGAGVRVRVGKPFAVAQAGLACVEIYRGAGPDDAFGQRMMAELGLKRPQVPFPLTGRLDEFLRAWKQD